jgi:hypothetical protein
LAQRDYSERPLLDKLGVKPEARVAVLGVDDARFLATLRARAPDVSTRLRKGLDLVLLQADRMSDLARLERARAAIFPDGAVWVVYPKGRQDIRDVLVIEAGLAAGMVDNKTVRFSDSHTALRFVVRLRDRQ